MAEQEWFVTGRRLGVRRRRGSCMAVVAIMVLVALSSPAGADHSIGLTTVSSDPFNNPGAQHETQVEPDTYAFSGIIVSAFQSGRYSASGAVGIGFATSSNGGLSWTSGHLPGLTIGHGGDFARVSDPSVAYSRKDNIWLITSLAFSRRDERFVATAILTSRSFDGGLTWSNPSKFFLDGLDKNWVTCDNSPASTYYGRCYLQFHVEFPLMRMSTSTNAGATWGAPKTPVGQNEVVANGWGGQPVVGPFGVVVVPYTSYYGSGPTGQIRAFRSVNGGDSWVNDVAVADVQRDATQTGDLRGISQNFPSAEIDAQGRIYVVWSDCRFRVNCSSGNDLVMSRSVNGAQWTPPLRVTFTSGNHVIPAMAVDRDNGGRLGVVYLRTADPDCHGNDCAWRYGYVSSTTGGASWSPQTVLSPPMRSNWMPLAGERMLGDYISASVMGGRVFTVLPIAQQRTGPVFNLGFNQAMYYPNTPGHVPSQGLPITGGNLTSSYFAVNGA